MKSCRTTWKWGLIYGCQRECMLRGLLLCRKCNVRSYLSWQWFVLFNKNDVFHFPETKWPLSPSQSPTSGLRIVMISWIAVIVFSDVYAYCNVMSPIWPLRSALMQSVVQVAGMWSVWHISQDKWHAAAAHNNLYRQISKLLSYWKEQFATSSATCSLSQTSWGYFHFVSLCYQYITGYMLLQLEFMSKLLTH